MHPQKKRKKAGAASGRRADYHPLARRAINLSVVACLGYALAVVAAIVLTAIAGSNSGLSPIAFYILLAIAAAMLLVNIAGLASAIIVLAKHRIWLDGVIALLCNSLPLVVIGLLIAIFHLALPEVH